MLFDIPEEEVKSIFEESIYPYLFKNLEQSFDKEAFIVGGQPGSGKSALAREILKDRNDIIFINGDDLRVFHPKYYGYLMRNDIDAADMTQAVCNFWIEEAINRCLLLGKCFMVEGTFRRAQVPLKTADRAKACGYNVYAVVVVTPYELSLKSITLRYEAIKNMGGYARYTKKESHDEAFDSMPTTLEEISKSSIFDAVYLYKRQEGAFYKNLFLPPFDHTFFDSFNEGRSRVVSEKETELPLVRKDFSIR